jgi:broad specificity phosphatase PhoE
MKNGNPNFRINNIKKLLIIVRHGERIDRTGEIPKCGIMNPELTEKGKRQSYLASKVIIEQLKKYGIKNEEIFPNFIQIRSSPYMRTIQTSAYLIKGLNSLLSKEKNERMNILNKIYIDFGLRKRIKPDKKFNKKDYFYKSVDKYVNFDEEIKNIEFIGEKGEFPLEEETKEQCEKRSVDYVNNILKKEFDNKSDNNKIIIIIGHRGPMKFILKKFGLDIPEKKTLDYCTQFFFDVTNGIDNSKFLEIK